MTDRHGKPYDPSKHTKGQQGDPGKAGGTSKPKPAPTTPPKPDPDKTKVLGSQGGNGGPDPTSGNQQKPIKKVITDPDKTKVLGPKGGSGGPAPTQGNQQKPIKTVDNGGGGHGGPKQGGNPPGTHKPPPKPLNKTQQDALAYMTSILKTWGLTSLLSDLKNFIVHGDTAPDTLTLKLSQTKAYKERFKANDIRRANGLGELLPAEYLTLERSYHDVLQSYGLPKGFYDKVTDFTDFIGKDISASELDARAKIAHDQYMAAPAALKNLWSQYYGKGDIIAGILDPSVATQVIQDRSTQIGIGGAAAMQGINVNQSRAEQFQRAGISIADAQKAYATIAQAQGGDSSIADRFGTTFDQADEENSLLLNDAAAIQKRQTLYGEEEGLFKGHAGSDANTIGVSQSY